ncbi:MAG: 50S ribosomal protein L22 [Deltaproteobacteria bacterium]|nr:50S ribosomal protein L22 [Deltaproteobacteria bacterium]MBI4374808.1 50S ribosomal protein L22 [Deltaproteobacteria bacterium]
MSELAVKLRYFRVAPRKVRLVADQVRGKKVQEALDLLAFLPVSSAKDMSKLIRSAVSNADRKGGIDVDNLVVRSVYVDQGPTLRRFMTRARGSSSRVNKKTSHITVVLEER